MLKQALNGGLGRAITPILCTVIIILNAWVGATVQGLRDDFNRLDKRLYRHVTNDDIHYRTHQAKTVSLGIRD